MPPNELGAKADKLEMVLPDGVGPAHVRRVQLAGREFTIAPLSLRQTIAIATHLPKVNTVTAENLSGESLTPLAEIVWQGVRRAHPKLGHDEFFDLPITIAELIEAVPVVIDQAGGGRKSDAAAAA
jgi:hypothetical protein